ncbi:MAG: helix-turn-helix transcriptional regulator [Myxococcota bacterium]
MIAVVFGSPDAISRASIQALGEVYGLTAAESGVVRGLVEGHSIEEVAARRKVKTETARGQLKQVFAKTGTTRQAELIRLVLTGVSPLSQPQSAQPGGERIP